ncbi:zinc-binding alcohol dehydrogenase family protein [Gordonia sp. CPCC 205333]|uniref:zinc-binding alcohol dehydrogenase family protein n=1 Tax=Gordonia sp. CPCC 205333 TaxID=3140790 RepID=UPI003AF35B0B
MKAAVVSTPNATPTYSDFPEPRVDDRHIIVDLVAAGIHPIVRSRISGQHYSSDGNWPAVPGVDAVARTADGRLIYTGFVDAPWGTMAERLAVPAAFSCELPEGTDPLAVAAGCNPGLASWIPLARRADHLDGDLGTVLILGATGMAGRIAIDNAFALGAKRVVAVGRQTEVLADRADQHLNATGTSGLHIVTLGADGPGTDAEAITATLRGQPPTTVIDFVWGSVAESAFAALGHPSLDTDDFEVTHIEIGTMAGADAKVPGALLRSRGYTLSGSGLGGTPLPEILRRLPEFIGQIASGAVHIPYTAYPLPEIDTAWTTSSDTRAVVTPN